jgi:uncharacterized protein YfaS (alpha-2-macroglobulin family)
MKRLCTLLFLLTLVVSCDRIPEVGIERLGFGKEVQLLQNLIFEFDEDLVSEVDLNQWESTSYLDFEPKIQGKFKWIGKKELVFSPAKPMMFATEYKAKLSDKLLKRKKGKLTVDKEEVISFHTPSLKVKENHAYTTVDQNHQKRTRILLELNGRYDTHSINDDIEVLAAGSPIAYKVLASENATDLVLELEKEPKVKELKIKIGEKVGNPGKFQKKTVLEVPLHKNDRLQVVGLVTSYKKLKGYIAVKTSQSVDLSSVQKNLKISPEIKYSVEATESGFVVKGDFNQEDVYTLSLSSQLSGVLGGKMDDNYQHEVYFGVVDPYLQFTNRRAQYISTKGNKNVGVNIVNIPKVRIKISKVYENNLLPFINSSYQYYDEGGSPYRYFKDPGLYSDEITNKAVETADLPTKQGVAILNMPLPDQTSSRGVYYVSIGSEDEYYRSIQKILSVSDIGLISKLSRDQECLTVYANSIMSAESIEGVEVKLISQNNQEMIVGKTDKSGKVVFHDLKKKFPTYSVAMITAAHENDFNYILFEDTEIETSKFDVEGRSPSVSGLEAFIYGEREIYRPGETVHFNAVVRNYLWETPQELPVKIKVKQPRGKEISAILTKTNSSGAVEHSVKLDRAALTGFYTLEVLTGNDVLIASKSISVEDFMPDRIKVQLEVPNKTIVPGTALAKVTATNLFGPPASGKKYEMEFSIGHKRFAPKGYEDFNFGISDPTRFEKELVEGSTNAEGLGTHTFEISEKLAGRGLLEGKILVSVFDESNRPVHRLQNFDIYTQQQFLGVRLPSYFTSTNAPYPLEFVAFDANEKVVSVNAEVEIFLLDYQTVLEKTENGLRYVSKKKEKLIKSQQIQIKDKTRWSGFLPKISGEYEVRVKLPGAETFVASNFYAYGYGTRSSFEVDTDGEVQITTDKSEYGIGETVKAIFKTPFDGKLLVTVENEGIIEESYLNTEQKSADFSFKLAGAHLPNVYITATLIRPMDQPEMPLMSAHGLKSVKVDDLKRKLPIVITAQSKVRSQTRQTVEVKTTPHTELTVAVVDEGILQIKNSATPDIYKYFYQKRALGTRSFDLYPLLLPEIALNNVSKTGGDAGLSKRVNPLANGRAELVAKWSGIIKTDASGKAKFEYEIPEFLGKLRVMVVAYDEEKMGSAEQEITVSDPISMSVGMPLFLSPNDKLKVPVTFFNTTELSQTIKISASTEGKISAGTLSVQELTLAPNQERFIEIEIKTAQEIGLGKLKVQADNGKEKFSKTTEISVRPAGSLHKSGVSGILVKDKEVTFIAPETYMKGTLSSKVFISPTPIVQFGHRLRNLLEYPYGCTEQVISRAFAQLYFEDLATVLNDDQSLTESGVSERNPRHNVQSAIEKLQEMQMYNGAVPYWPGREDPQWWVTAYALHFVIEAEKAGYEVPKSLVEELKRYLVFQAGVEENKKETYYVTVNNKREKRERIRPELAYSLYVLSLTDDPYLAGMNELKAEFTSLPQDLKFLLACSYMQIGDERSFRALLPKSYIREKYDPLLTGSFSSPVRNMALVLNALIESDPANNQIVALTQSVNGVLSNKNNYLNTQELAFSLLAMGKTMQQNKSEGQANVLYENKVIKSISKQGEWIELTQYPKGIKISGDQMYYYQVNEGIPLQSTTTIEDKGLVARRAYFTRDGVQIKNSTIKQNQLVVVRLTLKSGAEVPYQVDNVVLTDILPAGLEIENPRLVGDRDMTWINNAAEPDFLDIRDDRIHFFVSATTEPKYYYYLARAVTQGAFIQGSVSADAMYNPFFRSYWGGGRIMVN